MSREQLIRTKGLEKLYENDGVKTLALRGVGAGERAAPVAARGEGLDLETELLGRGRGLLVNHAFLHPHGPGAFLDGLPHDGKDILRFPENIHNVHFPGDGREVGVAHLPQYRLLVGVDRDDPVAVLLQIDRHDIAGSLRVSGESHHGHRFGVPEYFLRQRHRLTSRYKH